MRTDYARFTFPSKLSQLPRPDKWEIRGDRVVFLLSVSVILGLALAGVYGWLAAL